MSTEKSSIRDSLRDSASKFGQRYMDFLGINRKEYSKLLDEGSAAAQNLAKQYPSTREHDGSEIAAHHKNRLDWVRKHPRGDHWEPEFPPDRPPDEHPFDELPDFPSGLEQICYYTPVVTLDTPARHLHTIDTDGEESTASFTDDLSTGLNQCLPSAQIVTLRPNNTIADPTTAGFYSSFRFNFTPPTTDTYRFKPAAFVNGFAYTLEVGGILNGIHVGPTWSINAHLTLRVSQFETNFYRLIEREIVNLDESGVSSDGVTYDATSDTRAALEGQLEANHRVHVVVGFKVTLRSPNSFPSIRFDGFEQYFKVPEVYVDKLKCYRLGEHVILPPRN
jgi:hypothetical protein